jgi:uncharacterized membrane protein
MTAPRTASIEEEDRILRVWTPVLLRTILIIAAAILLFGLFLMTTKSPEFYVSRFRAAQAGHHVEQTTFAGMLALAMQGDPHSVMTLGLYVLTLVPLARVAFCFLLFIKERDYAFVGFTAYVLAGLILGIVLGRIG